MAFQTQQQFQPYSRSRPGRWGWWWALFPLLAFLSALTVWALAAPGSLARLVGPCFSAADLKIEGLALKVEGRDKFMAPGDRLRVHPQASLLLEKLLSNRWRNYDLRLYSPDFDVALAGRPRRPVTLAGLMGAAAFDEDRELAIQVKDDDKDKIVAVFTLVSGFSALDWAARGDAAADSRQKAAFYRKALARQPDDPAIRRQLAAALTAEERLEEVAELWEEAYALNDDRQYLLQALEVYRKLDQFEGQERLLRRLADLAEDGRPAYLKALATLYSRHSRRPEARAVYEKLLEGADRREKMALLTELADLYRRDGQPEQERAVWRRLLAEAEPGQKPALLSEIIRLSESLADEEGLRQAWRELAEALPEGPQKAAAYKRQGFLEARAQHYPEARRAYQAALALDAADPNVYLNLARLELALGLKAGYRENLEKLVRLSPENYDYLAELIAAYQAEGLREPAVTALRGFLARQPAHQEARLRLMAFLEEQGDQAALLAEYETLLKNSPDDKVALYNLGVLSHTAGRLDLARRAFEKVLALEPADLEARDYLLAIYQAEKKDDLAAAQARAIYELKPERTEARDLALAHFQEAGKWPELAQLAEKWLKTAPDDPVLWRALSRANLERGRKLEAAENLRSAAELTPGQAEPWLWAGAAFEEAGRAEEAQKAYQKALNASPQNAKASEALLRLNQERLRATP